MGYFAERGVSYTCVTEKVVPVTFPTFESYMIIKDASIELNDLEARFDIRSYRLMAEITKSSACDI